MPLSKGVLEDQPETVKVEGGGGEGQPTATLTQSNFNANAGNWVFLNASQP